MPYTDRTPQFRELISKSSLAGLKRRRTARQSKRVRDDCQQDAQAFLNKEYIREAYNILNHVKELHTMLTSIRRAYLNVDSSTSTLVLQPPRSFELKGSDQTWSSIRHLSNEERDQIDLQARIILTKCAERVKEMEVLEHKRAEVAAADTNLLTRFLPSRRKQHPTTAASANLAAHHASVTYYLNSCLAAVGQHQKEMQEERIRRQTERTRTLGSGASREAVGLRTGDPLSASSITQANSSRGWLGGAASTIAASIGVSPQASSSTPTTTLPQAHVPILDEYDDDEDDDMELSASQIQQFESENANLLRSVQDTLASVQQAESRLLEISALQTELVAHLTRQTEITDQLYEDAIATSESVDKGNVQLREAKRRQKDSRLFILVFLIAASFALLFLHYY